MLSLNIRYVLSSQEGGDFVPLAGGLQLALFHADKARW